MPQLIPTLQQHWKNSTQHKMLADLWTTSDNAIKFKAAEYLIARGCQTCEKGQQSFSGLKTLFTI